MVRPSFRGLAFSILGAYIILFLGSGILTKEVNKLTDALGTMYYDRLLPAKDIFFVQDLLYRNRLLLEEHIISDIELQKETIELVMHKNTLAIDSIISDFSKTLLVEDEEDWLKKFYERIESQRKQEKSTLQLSRQSEEDALAFFNGTLNTHFSATLETLDELEYVQESVGKELLTAAQKKARMVEIISKLLLAISLISATFLLFYLKNYAVLNLYSSKQSQN